VYLIVADRAKKTGLELAPHDIQELRRTRPQGQSSHRADPVGGLSSTFPWLKVRFSWIYVTTIAEEMVQNFQFGPGGCFQALDPLSNVGFHSLQTYLSHTREKRDY
jgi:hypothetical protein